MKSSKFAMIFSLLFLLSCGDSGSKNSIDARDLEEEVSNSDHKVIRSLKIASDESYYYLGDFRISISSKKQFRVYNLLTKKVENRMDLRPQDLVILNSKSMVGIVADRDSSIPTYSFDLLTFEKISTFEKIPQEIVGGSYSRSASIIGSGKIFIYSDSRLDHIYFFDIYTGKIKFKPKRPSSIYKLSPDTSMLLTYPSSDEFDDVDVTLHLADSNETKTFRMNPHSAQWSPDGRTIYIRSQKSESLIIDAQTGKETLLLESYVNLPSAYNLKWWSPNGKYRFVFSPKRGGGSYPKLYNTETNSLISLDYDHEVREILWSPNNEEIILIPRNAENGKTVVLKTKDGSQTQRVFQRNNGFSYVNASFSKDGKYTIVRNTEREKTFDLYEGDTFVRSFEYKHFVEGWIGEDLVKLSESYRESYIMDVKSGKIYFRELKDERSNDTRVQRSYRYLEDGYVLHGIKTLERYKTTSIKVELLKIKGL